MSQMSQMIQMVKNYVGVHNFNANLPKMNVDNKNDFPKDIADITMMKNFVDKVMINFRSNEQLDNDLNRKEGAVVGSVKHGGSTYSGTLEYDPKTEKPVSFKAESSGHSMFSDSDGIPRISMEYKDDGKMTVYSFTSNPESLFRIDGQFWHVYGTEALAMDSKTGTILETMLPKS